MTYYAVLVIERQLKITLQNQDGEFEDHNVNLLFNEGMAGLIPVFINREDAENFVADKDWEIMEIKV